MLKENVSIDIPDYSYVAKSGDFAGYEMISGDLLAPWVFKELSKKEKEMIVDQLITFINEFHSLGLETFAKYHPRDRKDFISQEKKIEKALEEKLFPKLPKNEIEVIKQFYKESKNYFEEIPNICPTHGDLYAFNTLWDNKTNKIGIIDFSDLLIGDPAKDFEVFYDYGPEYAEIAYRQYTGKKDKNFLRRAEIYYKLHAIYTLLSSQLGALISFDHSHMRFRQKFKLE